MRRSIIALTVLTASASLAQEAEEKVPVPERFGFSDANVIDGKLGIGTWFANTQPFGASTGFGTLFGQVDWDGIQNSRWSFHLDFDARLGLLYEPADVTVRDADGLPVDPNNLDEGRNDPLVAHYKRPGLFLTGRSYDYIRLDSLYGSYEAGDWGINFGRFILRAANSTTYDGVDVYFNLGRKARLGAAAGLRPNPWHQQVVGANSGGFIFVNNEFVRPLWHTLDQDGLIAGDVERTGLEGAGSNNLALLSTRFAGLSLYGNVREASYFLDGAVNFDLFDFGLDRAWLNGNGGFRFNKSATLNFRSSLDVIGARPFQPRDLMVDFTWRDLGPARLSATYTKFNTYATGNAFASFFRPLENSINDPGSPTNAAAVLGNLAVTPYFYDEIAPDDPDAADKQAINDGTFPLNNAQLFLVDRDRINLSGALRLSKASTVEAYAMIHAERRGDAGYVVNPDLGTAAGGAIDGLLNVFLNPCSFDANDQFRPTGVNPAVPVYEDLCRLGGTIGVRDPFMGGNGTFDLHVSRFDGFFSTSTRVAGRVGAGLGDTLWFEVGGAYESNTNARTFTVYDPERDGGGLGQFASARTNALMLDATVMYNMWEGLTLEATYFGFVEDVPFQGDTFEGFNAGTPQRRDTTQSMNQLYGRFIWRF